MRLLKIAVELELRLAHESYHADRHSLMVDLALEAHRQSVLIECLHYAAAVY